MIRFTGVGKVYDARHRPALRNVDLHLAPGEFAFLVGASGSGKSTVMRLILREDRPTSGGIEVAGRDLQRIRRRQVPRLRREIGMVFQDFRLLPDKTAAQNVAYVMHVLGASPKAVRTAVPATLELVGLQGLGKRMPHELSGGEQQRLAIARAVVKNPRIVLADEPTGNLDPATSLEIVTLLNDINSTGTTVLMATHDDTIVDVFRKRVIELEEGEIVRDQADGGYGRASGGWPVDPPIDPGTDPAVEG
ncbi:MAG: cell division ATP-binding protein FtsE [Austwickia sp.]|jgi:cell division transport system ATP-binding protein|nr:cell division ATP-binding protein FtsE [Austwickia sp.]MBK8435843.1 cell division ATP-binding protein FtsE [Austwickia sp.]MBK9101529.1 cell division ATP-binding protein FtsE [Austwickia sp.]